MARKTKEDTRKTYLALLEAAAELFKTKGYTSTTLNEISQRAGVTRGAFYGHFSNKTEVVRAIWEEQARPTLEPIRKEIENLSADNPAQQFRDVINRFLDLFSDDSAVGTAIFIILHNMEVSGNERDLFEFMSTQHEIYQSGMCIAFKAIQDAGQLRDGVDVELAAKGCVYLFMGMVHKALLPMMEFELGTEGKQILESYLNGVLQDKPS